MVEFAEAEHRSLGNLGAILIEWAFEKLNVAGSTNALFGSNSERLNDTYRDGRFKDGRVESSD